MKSPHSILAVILLTAAACGPSKERIALDNLRNALDSSTETIKDGIDQTLTCMDNTANSPIGYSKAIIWMPKVQHLRHATDSSIAILDSISSGQAKAPSALLDKLSIYYKALQSITTSYSNKMSTVTEFPELSDTLLQRILLSRIKNEIVRTEYAAMQYSFHQLIPSRVCIDYVPELMISSTRPRSGDTVCIKGWYGLTMSNLDLAMTIGDATIPQGKNDVIEYKFVPKDPPGPHPLRVQMSYAKPDGTTGIVEKTFNYTVRP